MSSQADQINRLPEDGDYVEVIGTGRIVRATGIIRVNAHVGTATEKVEDILTGELLWCLPDELGPRLNEMEVLAHAARGKP